MASMNLKNILSNRIFKVIVAVVVVLVASTECNEFQTSTPVTIASTPVPIKSGSLLLLTLKKLENTVTQVTYIRNKLKIIFKDNVNCNKIDEMIAEIAKIISNIDTDVQNSYTVDDIFNILEVIDEILPKLKAYLDPNNRIRRNNVDSSTAIVKILARTLNKTSSLCRVRNEKVKNSNFNSTLQQWSCEEKNFSI